MAYPFLREITPRHNLPVHRRKQQCISIVQGSVDRRVIVAREIRTKERTKVQMSSMCLTMSAVAGADLRRNLIKLRGIVLPCPHAQDSRLMSDLVLDNPLPHLLLGHRSPLKLLVNTGTRVMGTIKRKILANGVMSLV